MVMEVVSIAGLYAGAAVRTYLLGRAVYSLGIMAE
jgi:hypothetical protein